jgi:DNA-binding PadR family transcriptional regulator
MDVKTLCLGVLSMGDASGYEIKKVFEDAFSHFYVAGFGSIYPALAELTREGYVTCSDVEQAKRPAKKVYHLTGSGEAAFRVALAETYPSHRVRSDFMVLLVFADLLTPAQLAGVLQQRLADIDETLSHIRDCTGREDCVSSSGAAFAAGIARAMLEAGREYIVNNREGLLQGLENKDTES